MIEKGFITCVKCHTPIKIFNGRMICNACAAEREIKLSKLEAKLGG